MIHRALKSSTTLTLCLSLSVPGCAGAEAGKPLYLNDKTTVFTPAGHLPRLAQASVTGLPVDEENALRDLLSKRFETRNNPNLRMTREERTELRKLLRKYSRIQGNPGNKMSLAEKARLGVQLGLSEDLLIAVLEEDQAAEQAETGEVPGPVPEETEQSRLEREQKQAERERKRLEREQEQAEEEQERLLREQELAARQQAEIDQAETERQQAEREQLRQERAQLRAEREQKRAARQARREAREAEAAAVAAASDESGAGSVTSETVTEEQSRSADQEFDTPVGTSTAAQTSHDSRDRNKKLAAIALLGLGALAVGKVLKNGDKVVANTGDRVVVEREGDYYVMKDDDTLLHRPGREVRTETFSDGSSRTRVSSEQGIVVETIRAPSGRVLRRDRIFPDGRRVVLFDDTQSVAGVVVSDLPQTSGPGIDYRFYDEDALRAALQAVNAGRIDRRYSLSQIRNIDAVRKLVPEISVNSVQFASGSAAIRPQEARELATLGRAISEAITRDPGELFLIEGHTDAVGSATYNLALSDRRAESLALALVEYFGVPPENLVVQGYGESDLRIDTLADEPANRRAAVRRITPLLRMAAN